MTQAMASEAQELSQDSIEAVAAGLTRLQIASLTTGAIKDGNQWWVGGSNRNLANLRNKGLARGMGRFTEFGLDVRAYLQSQSGGESHGE